MNPVPALTSHSTFAAGRLGLVYLLSALVLSGCSLWPKALTFSSSPAAAECKDCTAAAKPEPAASAPAEPASAPVAPVASSTPVPSPAVREAALPINDPPPPPPAPAPAAPVVPAGLVPGFYINVGLFAVPSNGTNAFKKLETAGLPVFSDAIERKGVKLTRVRVGPFATRALADTAAKNIRALKLEAQVFRN